MRIFSLEYFRQIINSDEVNFLAARKKTLFKIKNQLGPFICNKREVGPKADKILQQMKFRNGFMWQYDPHGVINKLRIKEKLGPFIHHPRPDIEQFANQSEWLENTLIDMENIVVDVENTPVDLEKQIDQSSFLQIPELGEPMSNPPVLQTPANEENNPKRNREEGSSSAMETTYELFQLRKMPKLNHVSEQGQNIESVKITDTKTMGQRRKDTAALGETQQPSTSNTQMIERQKSVEVSSFVRPADREKDIKHRYKEIKMRNEKLKSETYAQYFKHTPTNQSRLMSAFDIKAGTMQVSFFQPIVQQPKTSIDYKKTNFEVLDRDVHPIDQIEFHKQAGKMIYSTLTGKAMAAQRLQDSLDNVTIQYKLEKASS